MGSDGKDRYEAFYESLPAEERGWLEKLEALGFMPTGSRLFCPWSAREDSDWDMFGAFVNPESIARTLTGLHELPASAYNGEMVSVRLGRMNLLLFRVGHPDFEAFKVATECCVMLEGPEEKPKRVHMFNKIRDDARIRAGMRQGSSTTRDYGLDS